MEPTQRFQLALPDLLQPVSLSLSALHAAKRPPAPLRCPSCGLCLFLGTSRSRLARSKNARVLETTCLACDRVQITPLELTGHGDRIPPALLATRNDSPRDGVAADSQTSRDAAAAGKPTRPKKKTGLHAMLVRNREQERERVKSEPKQHGLSAFLDGL